MKPELLKAIDPLARTVGLYTSYELSEMEFVGSVGVDTTNVFKKLEDRRPPFVMEHDLYRTLTTNGYETSPTFAGITLEAARYTQSPGGCMM